MFHEIGHPGAVRSDVMTLREMFGENVGLLLRIETQVNDAVRMDMAEFLASPVELMTSEFVSHFDHIRP